MSLLQINRHGRSVKESAPIKTYNFLEYLKTHYNQKPQSFHTGSDTEFSNTELQQEVCSRGIIWHMSSSHAPE